jgi:beta-glucosidase
MPHPLPSILVLAACALSASPVGAAQTVYTPPVIPPGQCRAMVAAPRDDWLEQVQDNFNKTQGKHFDLVFDGESFIAGWQIQGRGLDVWNARYAKLNAVDFGILGDFVQNDLWRLQHGQLDGIDPKLVVLLIGTHNTKFDPPEKIAAGIKVLLDEYEKDAPHARIILMANFPQGAGADDPFRAKIAQLNSLIAPFADGQRVVYLDIGDKFLAADGSLSPEMFNADMIHPKPALYQTWADALQPEIDKVFPPGTASPQP